MERQIWVVGGREEKRKREEKGRVNRAFYMCEARERLLPIGVNSDFFVSVLPTSRPIRRASFLLMRLASTTSAGIDPEVQPATGGIFETSRQ